jgi:hypothetical protein
LVEFQRLQSIDRGFVDSKTVVKQNIMTTKACGRDYLPHSKEEGKRERENERERETWYNIQRHTPVTYYLQLGPTTYLFYYLLK